ncbi:MAG: ribosome-associated toxin RatA of RatAB toxin-antitoxin module [Cryomorphaceae bacterium]|jgi:ribosome-associated toxin RatA of RatAB toxin-antitoxin module
MKVSRSALLPYNAHQMFDVVSDVRSYPGFLNWCNDMQIISETDREVIAKLMISYGKLDFSFTTKNVMVKDESIQISLVDGPFSNLKGEWLIHPLSEQGCKVSLEMDFMFDSAITHKLFAGVFQKVIIAQLDAFQLRAQRLYG